jgi:hypothetical protein
MHVSTHHVVKEQLRICHAVKIHTPPLRMLSTPAKYRIRSVAPPRPFLLRNFIDHQHNVHHLTTCQ